MAKIHVPWAKHMCSLSMDHVHPGQKKIYVATGEVKGKMIYIVLRYGVKAVRNSKQVKVGSIMINQVDLQHNLEQPIGRQHHIVTTQETHT